MTSHRSFFDDFEGIREQTRRRFRAEERIRRTDPAAVRVWKDWTSVVIATGPADGVGRALWLRGWRWAFGSFWPIGHSAGAIATGSYPMAVAWAVVVVVIAAVGARSPVRRYQTAAERFGAIDGAPQIQRLGWVTVLNRTLLPVVATIATCWALGAVGAPWASQLLLAAYLGMHLWRHQEFPRSEQLVYLCRIEERSGDWFLGLEPQPDRGRRQLTSVRELRSDEVLDPGPWCASMHWPEVPPLRGDVRVTPSLIIPLPVGAIRADGDNSEQPNDSAARAVGSGRRYGTPGPDQSTDSRISAADDTDRLPADALAVLGLGPDASLRDARRAHRKLAKQHHPDQGGDPRTFRELQAAWEAIQSAAERAGAT